MSGEDLQKELDILKIKIPKVYQYSPSYTIIDGKIVYETKHDYYLAKKKLKVARWYKEKVIIDARAKELINVLKPKLEKYGIEEKQIRLMHALINYYTKKRARSCYNAEGIAIASILTAAKIGFHDINPEQIEKMVAIDPDFDLSIIMNELNYVIERFKGL